MLRSLEGREVFREFLRSEYSEDNLLFWLACEDLKKETDSALVDEKARIIYEDYVSILSPKEVFLPRLAHRPGGAPPSAPGGGFDPSGGGGGHYLASQPIALTTLRNDCGGPAQIGRRRPPGLSWAKMAALVQPVSVFLSNPGEPGLAGQRGHQPEPGPARQPDVRGGPVPDLHPDAPRLLPPFPQLLPLPRPPGQQEARLPRPLGPGPPPPPPQRRRMPTELLDLQILLWCQK